MRFNDFQLMKDGKPVPYEEAEIIMGLVSNLVWQAKLNVSVVLLEDA